MHNKTNALLCAGLLAGSLASFPASAAVYTFHFTGQYTLLDPSGGYMDQQPISSTLTYDDNTGSGFSASLSIANFDTFGNTATIYDISLQRLDNSNLIIGNMLADWGISYGIPVSMVWDATGLFNAINYGLQAGDVISGSNLKRNGTIIADVNSALPASDGIYDIYTGIVLNQGPAPLAVTTYDTSTLCSPSVDCLFNALSGGAPLGNDGVPGSPMIDGPFPGLNVNFDIGSGNSLTVLSVSAVPVPAAVWLFGSGLLALLGLARRQS